MRRTTINGKEIEHLDVIHHNTWTKFSIKDRIKIFFGATVYVDSVIYTTNKKCNVVESATISRAEFEKENVSDTTYDKKAVIKTKLKKI